MTKKLVRRLKVSSASLATVALTAALSGCDNSEQPVAEDVEAAGEVVSVGVMLSSPGLASGSDPAETSGAEIALAQAIVAEVDTIDSEDQLRWVPVSSADDPVAAIQDGDMEFMLGQFSDAHMTDALAWVGPYVSVTPALLIRQAPDETEEASTTLAPLGTIESSRALAEAPICVVANSTAADAELPLEDVTIQQTVTECEVGMRSGRYDAIAADDLQLAGVLMDQTLGSNYELLSWSDVANDEDVEVADELLETHQYWIGTTPEQCDTLAEALRTALSQGSLDEAFTGWEESTGLQPEVAGPSDVTTQHCSG